MFWLGWGKIVKGWRLRCWTGGWGCSYLRRSAKGATPDYPRRGCNDCISIHAPAKGATELHDRHHAECGHFNPRSREGSDRVKVVRQRHVTGISIHAPVKGATAQGGNPALPALNFNPRSREGSDNSGYVRRMNRIYFNPRSREGSDRSILNTTLHNIISIHAPAKGAT